MEKNSDPSSQWRRLGVAQGNSDDIDEEFVCKKSTLQQFQKVGSKGFGWKKIKIRLHNGDLLLGAICWQIIRRGASDYD